MSFTKRQSFLSLEGLGNLASARFRNLHPPALSTSIGW